MLTLVLRITDRDKHGYSIELLEADRPESTNLVPVKGASAIIPKSLELETPIETSGGDALTAQRVRELYSSTTGESDDFALIGEFLYRLVARGKVDNHWHRLRGEGVTRTILDIAPDLRELQALPWELMYDRATGTHLFLDTVPMLRCQMRQIADPNPEVSPAGSLLSFPDDDWPLRVLVIFGASPEFADGQLDEKNIGARAELNALEAIFASHRFDVEFQVLENPSRTAIASACRCALPHVLHFIGHAKAVGAGKKHQLLIWEKKLPMSGYFSWPAGDIANDLRGIPLRFAFLNACRTADGSRSAEQSALRNAFATAADAFVSIGALGTLAMQGDVPGDIAAAFSRAFYEKVLRGDAVDIAAREARLHISQMREDVDRRSEWSYPVLRSRVHPALVLPRLPDLDFQNGLVNRFVARVPQRRVICDTVHKRSRVPPARLEGSPTLIAIIGERDAGKSHLAKWCTQVCARNGLRTAYIEFARGESVDVIAALRWIRDGRRPPAGANAPKAIADAPLPARAFRQFNWHLNHHLNGVSDVPDLPAGDKEIFDDGVPLAQSPAPVETIIRDTLQQFCLALEEAAKPGGLVLVLDQIEGLEATALTQWLPRDLFRPVASGDVKGVRIILVSRKSSRDHDPLKELKAAGITATEVNVDYFVPDEFEPIARYLCLQWSASIYDEAQESLLRVKKFMS